MKNIWKKIFVGALLTTAVAGFSGCKKGGDNDISVDLDGDGVVSEWEEVFEVKGPSDRLVYKTIKNIETLSDLKAINGKDKDTAYVLTKNIDCGGETLSINVGASNYIYGNNKIIRNFKLGEAKFADEEGTLDNGFKEYLAGDAGVTSRCLFYNAGAIYDLRLFMGTQSFELSDKTYTTFEASPFNSVQFVDNIVVKGAIKVKSLVTTQKTFNLSLCVVDHSNTNVEISNVEVQGLVDYTEETAIAVKLNMAGIIPNISRTSMVYGANVKSTLNAYVKSSAVTTGLVASENYGFVSTAVGNGTINVTYVESSSLTCGGIVGFNGGLAEVRNSTMNGTINFTSNVDFAVAQTIETSANVGGVVGRTEFGIVSYCTSDAVINGINLTNLEIGGMCGNASGGIFHNTISRGSINLTNIGGRSGLTVANIVGRMSQGSIEKSIALSDIVVDNHAFNFAKVRMGMATVFEGENTSTYINEATNEGEEDEIIEYYDMLSGEQKTPQFGYILVGGKNEVYTKTNDSDSFECNLGLRNKFLYLSNESGELESYTYSMQMFRDLYYLETYSVVQYYDNNGEKTRVNTLDVSYPMVGGTSCVKNEQISVACQANWFKTFLCFNYGANHNEVDLSGVRANSTQTLKTIRFTLDSKLAKTRYFENSQYNGVLSRFDKKFDTPCDVFAEDYNMYEDELFSYLNYLLQLDMSYIRPPVDSFYTSVVFNKDFFAGSVFNEGADGEQVVEAIYSPANFVSVIENALKKMGCTVSTLYLAKDGSECEANNENLFKIRIESASVSGGVSTKYAFDFDVRNFTNESILMDSNGNYCYIVNLMYVKY